MKQHDDFFLLFPNDHYGKKGRKTTVGKRKRIKQHKSARMTTDISIWCKSLLILSG